MVSTTMYMSIRFLPKLFRATADCMVKPAVAMSFISFWSWRRLPE